MKEFQLIVDTYYKYKNANLKAALATVVKVDGSAYRRPGARMLVGENGELTGAISGGCLEGDALRKAQAVIFQNQSMIVTYDTTDEDDQKFGIGLGCNGIIHILIEPIDYQNELNPVLLLELAFEKRLPSSLVTVFSLKNSRERQIGTSFLSRENQVLSNFNIQNSSVEELILEEIKSRSTSVDSEIVAYNHQENDFYVFYEKINPPVQVLLFGAGNDTIPLSKIADILGWKIILIDGRKQYATKDRFPTVSEIVVGPASEVVEKLEIDGRTVALLMTHNFDYDRIVLEKLLNSSLPYIGILGPKKKSEKLFESIKLVENGIGIGIENIFGPTGLDLGAENSEEIALAIIAEIKSVLSQKKPIYLREKTGSIHE
ncbi:XdhC family protein [Belliella sp. DSM 107340]|uniref:XdhC family protein n=1 Tax=Belliella calami TaxID=2923436 RepID=A0ABS9USQ2_9BACT|nr:XdhC/CoxI family protein [Belliella calami]MCH7399235.1 XdhC family protein [Belliella calami]